MGNRTCTEPDCDERHASRGYCRRHYNARYHRGEFRDAPKPTFEDRFWSKVEVRGVDRCWPWVGTSDGGFGYGVISRPGRGGGMARAHRVSWEIANGTDVPEGLFVCHRCDNPWCVNPAHLFLGTCTDNLRDMSRKGRARGGQTKLSEEQVRRIRAELAAGRSTLAELGRRYGVWATTIGSIANGRTWRRIA